MRKKIITLAIFGLICLMAVQAGGRKDNESHEADNPDGFTSSIPIENKKTGKWNFYIEAKDKGGNKTIAGAHNIYNDPVSDLPITTIINPRRNMHVQGNLNLVGMAIDDDGIDHVEFVITRGADGKGEELIRNRAEGKGFWSYLLDTTNEEIWTDGVYTLTAWAIDINGLEGISTKFPQKSRKFHQVSWHLDRKKPETKVTSHGPGALVSGKINLRGVSSDGNGIESLRYSTDEGRTYRPLPLKQDKRRNTSSWELKLDTLGLKDGPSVIWFQARDGMGTLGVAAHLLFVNNTDPEVKILYPEPDALVGGVFSVSAYANHPVGLRSVTWKLGKDSGEFPMVIGNSWWIQEFDIRDLKKVSTVDLEIRAEDLSGNVTVARRKLKVDQNAGMLKVNLEMPVANAVINGDMLLIRGSINTGLDEVAASVLYSIDSGAAVEIPCTGFFQIAVPDIPAGTHTLDMWAKDILGIEGPKVQVKGIVNPGPLPEPRLETVTVPSSKSLRNFITGMDINPEPRMVVDFAVRSAVPITSASISFNERAAIAVSVKAGKDGVYRADVPVPADLGSSLVKVDMKASDQYGREGTGEEFFFVSRGGTQAFQWVKTNRLNDGRILISASDETIIGLGGVPIEDVQVSGNGAENVRTEVDEYGRVQLRAVREGNFGPLTLSMNNRRFASEPFRILADFADPDINTEGSSSGWVQNQVQVQFRVSEANRLQAVDVSTDLGDSWQSFLSSSDGSATSNTVFNRNVSFGSISDGTVTILVRATDEAGRTAVKGFFVQKDNEAPLAQLMVPLADTSVNGTIRLGIAVKEAGALKSVTYNKPAAGNRPAISRQVYPYSDAEKLSDPRFLNILMDSVAMPLDNNMSFTFEDMAGNRSTLGQWPFIIDNEMDIPIVHIILPLEDEVITTDFEVSGVMFDDDAIRQIYWRIDNGQEQTLEADNGFSVPISLSGLTDNEHSVTVVAEDIYGVKSAPETRKFRVSLREPVASVTTPSFDMISGDFIEMSGGSFDENGIESVQISLDNGTTFNDARLNAYDNTAEWFYEFNSTILKDGPHVIFVRVVDKYDISAMYAGLLNIDNTKPDVALESPADGTITTGVVNILGEVVDVNLEEKVIELRSLQGVRIPNGFKIYRVGQTPFLKESFDMSALPDGFYNVEVQAVDKAGNTTVISRNIELSREKQQNFVDVLYPLNGEHVQGNFNLYGKAGGVSNAETVTLRVNNNDLITAEVTWTGHYAFSLNEEHLQPGPNRIVVHSDFGGGKDVLSEVRTIHYQPAGPWVTIDSLTMGDFAFERPWLSGRAGYSLSEEDLNVLADKKADKEQRDEILAKKLDIIDISFDNGSTFRKTSSGRDKNSNWSYRLETGEMAEGTHYILVRAMMKNGDVAVTRTRVQVDKTPPRIRLIAPEPGGHYNAELEFAAMASDDVELASLEYHLRVGDKMLYEVPGFLRGLYFEATIPPFVRQVAKKAPPIFAGGATYMDVGFGLSFFDDNVKVQVQYGFLTQALYESMGGEGPVRYGGHVLGIKLLANIYTLQFGRVAGPDWEWLSASFALGANFSLFDLAREGYTQSGDSTWMSALLLQIEFPKVTIPKREKLRTFSFFTEGQLWFVPTDVNAANFGVNVVIPHVILGLRLYIF